MKLGQNSTMQVEVISTGSLSLDLALGVGDHLAEIQALATMLNVDVQIIGK